MNNLFSLQNKTAMVTGGASGIGRAISQLFAQRGAIVHIIELNEAAAANLVAELKADGYKAFAHRCDVSAQDQVGTVVERITGRIDILVNNAGISHVGNVENTTLTDFEKIFSINVKGMYNCLHAVVPRMKKSGGGVIVNLGSIAASVGLTDRFAYAMSKGAVLSMTLSIARDYLPYAIRCNSISPARVHTPFVDGFIAKNYPGKEKEMFEKLSKSQPIGRMAKPEEVAQLALYLCSDEASFITGTDYPIDGGFIKLNN
jgi:NAD(P)-dependent dehydrogenase (short-subunit alcohol dehydrogenase family)